MNKIRMGLWGFLAALSLLWVMADTLWPQPFGYFAFRAVFVQYSGVLAIGTMSACMVLALRTRWLESLFGGLDKVYRLHKWMGIAALVTGVLHWWFARGTKWMVGWGWLERPTRRRPPAAAVEQATMTLEQWLRQYRHLAESVGEWAFYGAVVLIVLALVKRFPYHWFARTHKIIALGYLALVLHTVVLMRYAYWVQPVGVAVAVLLVAGSVAAVLTLAGRIGKQRTAQGQVQETRYFPAQRVLRTTMRMQNWPGHQAGQFAFVRLHAHEAPHPFTLASAWNPAQPDITIMSKALGDYTRTLPECVSVGMPVQVQGPYGCFTFTDDAPRHIWVGGGIGIAPFMARLQALGNTPALRNKPVDLFYTSAEQDDEAIALLEDAARAADVRLHVLIDARDGLLTGERIRAAVPEWQQASIWFCGPAGFGQALQRDFAAHGLPVGKRFHQELFAMR